MWLESIGVVSGCFPHITYISLLLLYLVFFAAAYIYILVVRSGPGGLHKRAMKKMASTRNVQT